MLITRILHCFLGEKLADRQEYLAEDIGWHDPGDALFGRPGDGSRVFGRFRAEQLRVHGLADPGQIEPVSVETGLHRDVLMRSGGSVEAASGEQKLKKILLHLKQRTPQLLSQHRPTRSVLGIGVFSKSPAVVEQREQGHNLRGRPSPFRQPQAIFVDPRPVGKAVKAAPVDRELPGNREDEFGGKEHGVMGGRFVGAQDQI